MISCSYSSGSNRFGTSPEFRMLLMSSKNSSTTIYKNKVIQYTQQFPTKQLSIYINNNNDISICLKCLSYNSLINKKSFAKFYKKCLLKSQSILSFLESNNYKFLWLWLSSCSSYLPVCQWTGRWCVCSGPRRSDTASSGRRGTRRSHSLDSTQSVHICRSRCGRPA